jgi:predicted secreted protein
MSLPLGIATYFTTWWVVLFAVLPFGVRSASEADVADLPRGADPGAPLLPNLGKKALWTTLVSGIVFAALDAYVTWAG